MALCSYQSPNNQNSHGQPKATRCFTFAVRRFLALGAAHMTRQSQKNEEIHYAQKASELLNEFWSIEESPDEVHWPDLMISNEESKFGLEVRNIFKDEGTSGSYMKEIESIRINRLKALSILYYSQSVIPISLKIRGDIQKNEISEVVEFIQSKVEIIKELEQYESVVPNVEVKIYIRRLPEELAGYNRWQNISDYVGWVSKLTPDVIERAIKAKESKIDKYSKNIKEIKLLLVLNRTLNSGRAELPIEMEAIVTNFSEIFILLYPEKIHRVKCT